MPFNPKSLKNLFQNAGKSVQESVENRGIPMAVSSVNVTLDQQLERADPIEEARQIIRSAAPAAAVYLQRVVTGATRVPAHVRLLATSKVLEACGIGSGQSPASGDLEGVAGAITQAMALRARAALAVNAEVVTEMRRIPDGDESAQVDKRGETVQHDQAAAEEPPLESGREPGQPCQGRARRGPSVV